MLVEVNIDSLVGPTHHFGGLGVGNLASLAHARQTSRPKAAALEGLSKAAFIARLGIPQYLLLPPSRPKLQWLERLGWISRSDKGIVSQSANGATNNLQLSAFGPKLTEQLQLTLAQAPKIFSAAYSSSFMWTANAATVTCNEDATDCRLHLTPANLISSWHRSFEAEERLSDLRALLQAMPHCAVHEPLPSIVPLRDEGAANHMRLWNPGVPGGINVFVYGANQEGGWAGEIFMPRQTQAACQAIGRIHHLSPANTFFLRQHPDALAAGVFHNDVIATSHENLVVHHQRAFWEAERQWESIESLFLAHTDQKLIRVEVSEDELPLSDAVRSYFFNSQIVTPAASRQRADLPRMVLICPAQCREVASAHGLIDRLVADSNIPIDEAHFISLEQSMANGGGPACLRLRLPLASTQIDGLPKGCRLDAALQDRLSRVIERYYPDELVIDDLAHFDLVVALMAASHEVSRALNDG
jgi:succinylarginine dihydrolase